MTPDPHNEPGPDFNDKVGLFTVLHPVGTVVGYGIIVATFIAALWWSFR